MTHLSLLLYCLFSIPLSYAQSITPKTFIKEKSKPFYVSLIPDKSDLNKMETVSVSTVEILDYRPDSSRVGFFQEKGNGLYEILLKNSSPVEIGTAIENALATPTGTRSFLIVLRKLWLSDIVSSLQTSAESKNDAGVSRISFRAEAYVKEKDLLVPLLSFDTVITSDKSTRATAPFRAPKLFGYLFNKLKTTDIDGLLSSRRKISYAEMDAFSRKSFLYPVDTVSTPRKGVYASLAEFKNNTPSITEYELQQEPGSPISIYLKDADGKSYLSRKIWGVCDGENIFIMMGGNLFPVIRSNHAFYIYGSQVSFVKKNTAAQFLMLPVLTAAGAIPGKSRPVTTTSFFALDMESGEIH